MPLTLCGFETKCLAKSEDHNLRVCEKKVVRKTVVLKGEEITGRRTKLNKEALRELVSSTAVTCFMK